MKKCPCGRTPDELMLSYNGQGMKWGQAACNHCGEWSVEFRTSYESLASDKCQQSAVEAWNEAPRTEADAEIRAAFSAGYLYRTGRPTEASLFEADIAEGLEECGYSTKK